MANYCTNELHIKFKSVEDKDIIFNLLSSCMPASGGFCGIADIVQKAGINANGVRCRGYVTILRDISDRDSEIFISYETAWEPLFEWLVKVLNQFVGQDAYEIVYHSEEPMEGLYFTNDKIMRKNETYADIDEFR